MIINPKISDIVLENIIGLDLETSGLDPLKDVVLVIAISTKTNTYILSVNNYSNYELKSLLNRVASLDVVIAHNANFDVKFLKTNFDILLRNIHCTMVCEEVLNNRPDFKPFPSLVDTLKRNLDVHLSEDKKLLQRSFIGMRLDDTLSTEQLEYAGDDTKYLTPLYEVQINKARHLNLLNIFKLENKLLPVLVKMELLGCKINVKEWRELIIAWQSKLDYLELELDSVLSDLAVDYPSLNKYTKPRVKQELIVLDLFGNHSTICNENKGNINYASSHQLKDVFNYTSQPIPLKGDGDNAKESLDEDSLKTFVNENPKSPLIPFIERLLTYREYSKLISTYGDKFLSRLDHNGCIHTSYTQCKTDTGRLSSVNPNLQNIPSNGDGAKIREFFIPRDNYHMVTCDMNGAEVAIAADYSGEPLLINALTAGTDMHSKLATVSFKIIFGDDNFTVSSSTGKVEVKGDYFIPNKLRKDHKSVTFAKFYKAGAKRIYQTLAKYINLYHKPEDRLKIASKISKALDKEMPQLTKYLSGVITKAKKQGYLVGSKLGRIRWFKPDPYGEAANMPIQNTNAEAMKMALILLDEYFEETGNGRLIMNIHDEVVCEIKSSLVTENKGWENNSSIPRFSSEVADRVEEIMAYSLSWFLTTIKGGATSNIGFHWEK